MKNVPRHPAPPAPVDDSDRLATDDLLAVSIALLRLVRRWSQSELAQASGLTNSAISDYERNRVDPQTRSLFRLVESMGYPLSALDMTRDFVLSLRAQIATGAASPAAAGPFTTPSVPADPRRREIAVLASEGARFTSRFLHLLFASLGQVEVLSQEGPDSDGGS
ncbi:MAG TPA: helix-turn-helix domain-containing protein [Thermoanaerobaculia bacterium]|nr:helix-turn-helix domain-containing protein [Thermoanaerobaculia bacterium]